MPQLGETVTEGTIIKWLKQVGDTIAQDEPLFEVSTEKVDSEVPSSVDGVLTEILVPEGATVDIGTLLAVVGSSASAASAAAEPVSASGDETVAGGDTGPAAGAATPAAPPAAAVPDAPASAAPGAATPAAPSGVPVAAASASGSAGDAGLLSPVVRKLINENGLDPAAITGSGQGGRITRGDVLTYLDKQATAPAPTTAPTPAAAADRSGAPAAAAPPAPAAGTGSTPATVSSPAAQPVPAAARGEARAFGPATATDRDEVVPFSNIRRLTAEHMVRSKATSAHTLAVIEADYEGIDKVRKREKDRFKEQEGVSLTYLSFVARAVVDMLREYPNLNASVGDGALLVHRDIHLGIAVDLDRQGLIVPVVRHADGQSLRGLARAIADLADRARSRRLSADDVVGGTFTITNPGPFGTLITAPIISQPQVAILSTDGVKRRPVVVTSADGSEAIAIHSVGMLALSFDHRAVDGAYASAFLRDLAREIETRDWSAEL
jgi:2-oxoglutarate dehydrogenase E2 component (dihydrolipoamide succinyltransferase)